MPDFGLKSAEDEDQKEGTDLALQFAPTPAQRPTVSLTEIDRAAEGHGFQSREKAAPRRRRRVPKQANHRFLAIRAPEDLYDRFVAYADRYELTYNDAIEQLLDTAEGKEGPR